MAPPPGMGAPVGEFGGAPQPGAPPPGAMPAPPQPPPPNMIMAMDSIMAMADAMKKLGDNFPQAIPTLQQMDQLMQQLQMKIVQGAPPSEPAAPPV